MGDASIGGGALVLDGSGDYVSVLNGGSLDFDDTGSYTWSVWAKTNDGVGMILENEEYALFVSDYEGFFISIDDQSGYPKSSLDDSVWNHLLVTYENENASIYINGAYKASGTSDYSSGVGELLIGKDNSGDVGVGDFNGNIDEVMMFNRTLTESEISTIYNAGR